MKFLHLADLHIGKRVNEFSMIDDQKYILNQIIAIVEDEKPDVILIAGDVYDKYLPSAEAVKLLDSFISKLSKKEIDTFIISGNHDSAERIAFGSEIMKSGHIYMSPIYDGDVNPEVLEDEYGKVNVYMLPFIKPLNVRVAFEDAEVKTYTDAVNVAIENMNVDKTQRNIIVSHQFVTGAQRCDSEEISVGGTDNVDASVYDPFDYVALGHIHGPQKVGRDTIRYAGTPLKYSFSECKHKKSVTIVEMKEKGNIDIRQVPLKAKRDIVEIEGMYETLMSKDFYKDLNLDDYYHIILNDEEDIVDGIRKLRTIYSNVMKLNYNNKRTSEVKVLGETENIKEKTPFELFTELFESQNNKVMSDVQNEYVNNLINKIWEND